VGGQAIKRRINKTIERKLADLDDHLFLLEDNLRRLDEDDAHLKVIAGELRLLICFSSGTEGLLWRVSKDIGTSDEIILHVPKNVDRTQPLSVGLIFSYDPIEIPGLRDPMSIPSCHSFHTVINNHEPVFICGKGITHEYLIKAVAQQMGSAHEDEGIEHRLLELETIFVQGVKPYIPILKTDAKLTLQIGNRVLQEANSKMGFVRKSRRFSVSGDVTTQSNATENYMRDFVQSGTSIEEEGTMAFRLIHENIDWSTDNNTYVFRSLRKSSVCIKPTKHSDKRIELIIKGIFGKEFAKSYIIPECDERGLRVAISWKSPQIRICMNGQFMEPIDME